MKPHVQFTYKSPNTCDRSFQTVNLGKMYLWLSFIVVSNLNINPLAFDEHPGLRANIPGTRG